MRCTPCSRARAMASAGVLVFFLEIPYGHVLIIQISRKDTTPVRLQLWKDLFQKISCVFQVGLSTLIMKTKVTEASLLILIFTNVSFTSANLPSSPPMPSNTNTNSKPNKSSQSTYSSSQKLAPCQSCRTLVKSFLLVSTLKHSND
jgi:hypothetical protein